MRFLAGLPVAELEALVDDALEPVLRPLVYAEPLRLLEQHRARGEPAFVVSATLHEIVARLARDLGFDGAIGTTAEIVDGVYTGRSQRPIHGEAKAEAVRELAAARGLDLGSSTAYSDSGERRAIPGSGRSPRRGEPGPAAPPDRQGAWLAGARLPRAVRACCLARRFPGCVRSASATRTPRRSRRTSCGRRAAG